LTIQLGKTVFVGSPLIFSDSSVEAFSAALALVIAMKFPTTRMEMHSGVRP
jgi:hypothetical protein